MKIKLHNDSGRTGKTIMEGYTERLEIFAETEEEQMLLTELARRAIRWINGESFDDAAGDAGEGEQS